MILTLGPVLYWWGVRLAVLTLSLSFEPNLTNIVSADVQLLSLEITQSRPFELILSDGSVRLSDELQLPCSIGPGILYVRDKDGACQDENSFQLKWGAANQISSDSTRTNYVSSTYTLIDGDVFHGVNLPGSTQKAFYSALVRGRIPTSQEYGISVGVVTSTGTLGPFVTITAGPGTVFVAKSADIVFCSTATSICSKTVVIGNTETFILAAGSGQKALIINANFTCPPYMVCKTGSLDAFVPRQTTISAPTVVGITYRSFWENGAHSEYNQGEQTTTIGVSPNGTRHARFAGFILYGTDQVLLKAVNSAFEKGLSAAQANDETISTDDFTNQKSWKTLATSFATLQFSSIQNQQTYSTLSAKNEVMDHVLRYLIQKVEAIESFTMFIVPRLAAATGPNEAAWLAAESKVNASFPDWQIIEKFSSQTTLYFRIQRGSFVTGTQGQCNDQVCHYTDRWNVFSDDQKILTIDSPVLYPYSCGLYFKGATSTDLAIIGSKSTWSAVMSYIASRALPYMYALARLCFGEPLLKNEVFSKLQETLNLLGLGRVEVTDNGYLIDCVKGNFTNDTVVTALSKSPLCGTLVASENLLIAAMAFNPNKTRTDNALQVFTDNLAQCTPLEKLMSEAGADAKKALQDVVGIGADVIAFFNGGFAFQLPPLAIVNLVINIVNSIGIGICFYFIFSGRKSSDSSDDNNETGLVPFSSAPTASKKSEESSLSPSF